HVGAGGAERAEGRSGVVEVLVYEMAARLDDRPTASFGELRCEFTGAGGVPAFGQEPGAIGVDAVGERGADIAGYCGLCSIERGEGGVVIAAGVPDPCELEVGEQEEGRPTGAQDVEGAL